MSAEIIVTGIGLITPLGGDRETTWRLIKEGRSLRDVPPLEPVAGEFAPFVRPAQFVNPNGLPKVFPMALAAAREALADAGWAGGFPDPDRLACAVAVSKPILPLNPALPLFDRMAPDSLGNYLAAQLGALGPRQNAVAACATGVHSILAASRWLAEGRCDAALAGAVESSLNPLFMAGFRRIGVLSDFPRPFDRRRDGFVLGEGAGILILERAADARARGARTYARVLSCAVGADCHHPTAFAPDGSSIAAVCRNALRGAGLAAADVDYVNAHGTGTRLNDAIETRALKKTFGARAADLSISSTKAATGHLLGASGGAEAALACLALRDRFVPPTAHLEEADPECDLDYQPLRGKPRDLRTALSLSFGFGGPIGAVLFGRAG